MKRLLALAVFAVAWPLVRAVMAWDQWTLDGLTFDDEDLP